MTLKIVPSDSPFKVEFATAKHLCFVELIIEAIAASAKERGTGRGKRTYQEIASKISAGKAIIALDENSRFAGFCYVESYEEGKFFANSGLIVLPEFRGAGLAKEIKLKAFDLGKKLFPKATPITITTSSAVMKLNSDLGYRPVSFGEITSDEKFWEGCKGCVNYELLTKLDRKNCLCTAMICDNTKTTKLVAAPRKVNRTLSQSC